VAVFARAAVAESEPDGELLTLLHPSRGLVPLGLCVDWDEARLKAGEELVFEGREARIGTDRIVELEGEGCDLVLRPSPLSLPMLKRQLESLRLPERTRELFGGSGEDLVTRAAGDRLRRLVDALWPSGPRASRGRDLEDAVLALIGLGPGSTPTGDDLLTGAAAVGRRLAGAAKCVGMRWDDYLTTLKAAPRGRTTRTAAGMLAHAAEGAFPENLLDFAVLLGDERADSNALQKAADRLAGLGAQTGTDMLAGALALATRAAGNHGGAS
jgi:hypothetical protein